MVAAVASLDDAALRAWPLPDVRGDADKEARGRVLVVAGSREIPGAAALAAEAALRAGAGKVALATAASIALQLGLAVPEARVIGLPETDGGGLAAPAVDRVADVARAAQVVLAGPGLADEEAAIAFALRLIEQAGDCPVVLDALAMKAVASTRSSSREILVTPHAGEMAGLLGCGKQAVLEEPHACTLEAARRWNCTVALKGAVTWIATPQGRSWRHEGDQPGLAMSGSGDVLAGLVAGLLARGAGLAQAAAWAVVLHARAGSALAARYGPLGYLARELAAEIPSLVTRR